MVDTATISNVTLPSATIGSKVIWGVIHGQMLVVIMDILVELIKLNADWIAFIVLTNYV
jgi:hypothetical protein